MRKLHSVSTTIKFVVSCAVTTLLLVLPVSQTIADVGRVLYTIGPVSIERPAPATLRRGDRVDEGEVIVTGPRGYVQVRLDDGTKVAIRPGSRFVIEALSMPAGADGAAVGTGLATRANFSLQKGGFRTITGRIARRDPSAYQVRTPSAVIRVRGTNYTARMCQADCGEGVEEDGLYVGVSDGGVTLSNNGGDLDLDQNQYGFAPNFNTPPRRLIAPPNSLNDEGTETFEEEEEGDDGEESEEGEPGSRSGDEGDDLERGFGADESQDGFGSDEGEGRFGREDETDPVQRIVAVSDRGTIVDITPGDTSLVTQVLSIGEGVFSDSQIVPSETLEFDAADNLIVFELEAGDSEIDRYEIGTAVNRNNGEDALTAYKWGRWSEGTVNISTVATDAVGGAPRTSTLDLNESSLHFVVGPLEGERAQAITGSADYVLVGNTDPTNNMGDVGILGTASLSANFTSLEVTNNVQIGISGQVWNATGVGTIDGSLFGGLYDSVQVDGAPDGSGTFTGSFGGFDGANPPLGAGLIYNLSHDVYTVTGAAVFNRR